MLRRLSVNIFVALATMFVVGAQVRAQSTRGLDPEKRLTQYQMDVWVADEGLPQKSIYSIWQSRSGYLWLGTQEGLVRFDGIDFRTYDKTNSALIRNAISAVFESTDGTIWVGTREGGLTEFRDGESSTTTREHGLSSDNVSAIAEDASGDLWVGTDDAGLNVVRDGKVFSYTIEDGLPSKSINVLLLDRQGTLWIGTRGAGLTAFKNGQFNTLTTADGLPGDNITALHEDSEGNLWIGTASAGPAIYSNNAVTMVGHDPSIDADRIESVSSILEDNHGSIWIGTDKQGLSRWRDGRLEYLTTSDGLPSYNIRSLMQDREGTLWIGTDGGGLVRLQNGKFTPWGMREGLAADYTYGVLEDRAGNIWIGTEGGGVGRLADGQVTPLTATGDLQISVVYAVGQTKDGGVWFGTEGGGLVRYQNGKLETYTTSDGLPTNTIYSLFGDSDGKLWIATSSGGLTSYHNGVFGTLTSANGLSSDFVTAILESAKGGLWVGTYDGGLNYVSDGRVISRYSTSNGLNSDYILSLHEDADGVLWVGTREGGIHRIKDGRVVAVTTKNGLFNDIVNTILEDDSGYLWMSCNKGLFKVRRDELNAFADGRVERITSKSYDRSDGLRSDEFNGGFQPAGWKGQDGRLWFPSDRGLVGVSPGNIPTNELPPVVHVESISADGNVTRVAPGARVVLRPGTHKFEFRYVGLSFISSRQIRYQYQLEGVDEAWADAGPRRVAYYTNLPPGDYTFRVRASNSDGLWNEEGASVSVYLKPFFYQTLWFQLLCLIAAISAGFLIYWIRVRHLTQLQIELETLVSDRTRDLREEKERTEGALQQTEAARREAEAQREVAERAKGVIEAQAEKLREMDRIKSRFFGNISHEFRTPLTLTIGPLENALTQMYGPVSPALSRQLEIMLRNSRRLLRLINQLLDLSKLEAGGLTLKVVEGNLVQMLEGVVMSFTAFAEKEGVELSLDTSAVEIMLYFDPESLEKVFFNLLSNAVKFTPERGHVSVSIDETTVSIEGLPVEAVEIRVADTGHGIPPQELGYIFDRFHQVDGSVSRVQEGTGIGLSLVKELVELHGGMIQVESELGEGTDFIVILPKGTKHLRKFELIDDVDESNLYDITRGPMMEMAVFEDLDVASAVSSADTNGGQISDHTVLVVDDSVDVRNYIVGCLEGAYRIVTAKDGIDGLDKAEQENPDLIVSDVMMPRMDGYEFCRRLKSDDRFNHIPVILLTSKASLEAKLEGLQAGSDEYLTKPFNAEELRVRIANLINMREQARNLKGLNTELESTNEALRRASDLKSQLLSIASHDMKNPLTAIREFSRILKEEIESESHLSELVDLIFSSSDEMLRLVTQLLDSSALESGKLELNTRPVDLSALAQLVVHRSLKQGELKGQTIHFSSAEEGKSIVMADFDRLQEAMNNVVNNAVKYTEKNKDIWVSVSPVGDKVRFEVRDEGPGIAEDELPKIFDKFQKLSNQPTGGENSTGLGLSIVKQIVEMHNGRVWVESEVGKGSKFYIELDDEQRARGASGDRPAHLLHRPDDVHEIRSRASESDPATEN
jgi:signal transduction histidine kinase/ligand-binding sensor domain-containing protein